MTESFPVYPVDIFLLLAGFIDGQNPGPHQAPHTGRDPLVYPPHNLPEKTKSEIKRQTKSLDTESIGMSRLSVIQIPAFQKLTIEFGR